MHILKWKLMQMINEKKINILDSGKIHNYNLINRI